MNLINYINTLRHFIQHISHHSHTHTVAHNYTHTRTQAQRQSIQNLGDSMVVPTSNCYNNKNQGTDFYRFCVILKRIVGFLLC